jgi:hypothetical protein
MTLTLFSAKIPLARWLTGFALALAMVVPVGTNAQAQEKTLDPKAQELLLKMTAYLRFANSLSFQAEISRDEVLTTGQKIERNAVADFVVHRPNLLRAMYDGDRRDVTFYYDGTNFTMVEPDKNVYGVIQAPSELDGLFQMLEEKYGISLPMGDLMSTDVYGRILEQIQDSRYIGLSKIRGVSCNHLSFTLETIDLQMWIAEGKEPVPCKFLITYREEAGAPQYSAILSNWNFSELSPKDPRFAVEIPPNSNPVDFIRNTSAEEEQ